MQCIVLSGLQAITLKMVMRFNHLFVPVFTIFIDGYRVWKMIHDEEGSGHQSFFVSIWARAVVDTNRHCTYHKVSKCVSKNRMEPSTHEGKCYQRRCPSIGLNIQYNRLRLGLSVSSTALQRSMQGRLESF